MKSTQAVRYFVQAIFFALFSFIVLLFYGRAGAHNICPFALVISPILALKHTWVFPIGIIFGGLFLLSSLIIPRMFCGWVCPVGFVSRLLREIGKRLGINTRISVLRNDTYFWFSVAVLFYICIMTAISGRMYCVGGCPLFWGYFFDAISISALTIALLTFFGIGSIFIERFFCRWFCPYGAILGLLGQSSYYAITKECSSCELCRKCFDCPMGTLPKKGQVVNGPMCISCLRCISVCKEGRMKMSKRFLKGGLNE